MRLIRDFLLCFVVLIPHHIYSQSSYQVRRSQAGIEPDPSLISLHLGTYEGLDSFFWYGMPNVFPGNVDEIILEIIKSLHS